MRKRFVGSRVCRCTPSGGMVYMEARYLSKLVDREIHPICCAKSAGWKALRAITIGDLCAEAKHYIWAIKIWSFAISRMASLEYEEYGDEWFDSTYVRLRDVIANAAYDQLDYRIGNAYRALGASELVSDVSFSEAWYNSLLYEMYDFDRASEHAAFNKIVAEGEAWMVTEALFKEGLGDFEALSLS